MILLNIFFRLMMIYSEVTENACVKERCPMRKRKYPRHGEFVYCCYWICRRLKSRKQHVHILTTPYCRRRSNAGLSHYWRICFRVIYRSFSKSTGTFCWYVRPVTEFSAVATSIVVVVVVVVVVVAAAAIVVVVSGGATPGAPSQMT